MEKNVGEVSRHVIVIHNRREGACGVAGVSGAEWAGVLSIAIAAGSRRRTVTREQLARAKCLYRYVSD